MDATGKLIALEIAKTSVDNRDLYVDFSVLDVGASRLNLGFRRREWRSLPINGVGVTLD